MVKHPALLFFPLYFTIIWFFSQLFDGRFAQKNSFFA